MEASSQNDLVVRSLCEDLQSVGNALTKDPLGEGTRALAGLQKSLEEAHLSTSDSFCRFIFFFLSLFVADVRYNLLGDFPFSNEASRESDMPRRDLFHSLGECLISISKELPHANHDACVAACANVTSKYIDSIAELNRRYSKAR